MCHSAIARSAGDRVIMHYTDAISSWLVEYHIQTVHRPGFEARSISEHREIVAASESKDGRQAHRAVTNHFSRANSLYRAGHRLNATGEGVSDSDR
jgi:DNA-binding FadR family transcriptional regulator